MAQRYPIVCQVWAIVSLDGPETVTRAGSAPTLGSRPVIRLLVTGQPRWSMELAEVVRKYTGDVEVFVARSPLALLVKVVRTDPHAILIVGFRPGAATVRGRAFDAITATVRRLRSSATIARYWIGTDVDNATRDAKAKRLTGAFWTSLRRDIHLAAAPWLAAELEAIGINAASVPFPAELPPGSQPSELPPRFRVLSYLGEGRFDYYGGPATLELARRFPAVEFDVVGCRVPAGVDVPPNVNFLGWRTDVDELILGSTVVVRLTRHDALSAVVREALAHARYVIWTYHLPSVHTVAFDSPDQVAAALAGLVTRHAARRLRPNEVGWRYVRAELDPGDLSRRLIAAVLG